MKTRSIFVSAMVSLMVFALVGCGDDSSGGNNNVQNDAAVQNDGAAQNDAATQNDAAAQNDAAVNPSHTDPQGPNNVMHYPGKNDPLANCTTCHGAQLQGGAGPSCYTCHNNDDHTINRLGKMHLSGQSSTCNACHGPSNTGGLGPACSQCH